jgi:3-hydroxybutyryl-CoA dehydrogenase
MPGPIPPDSTVAVIGAGTMGAGIAQVAAVAGHPVMLYDMRAEAVEKAIGDIRNNVQKLVAKGKLSPQKAGDVCVSAASSLNDIAPARLIIEAVIENVAAKRDVFTQVERIVASDCILATNTSSISITAIAAGLQNPGRVAGMHFFNPAPLMELVEVVSGLTTERDCAETVFATAEAWGKTPVHVKSSPGFIVNRVARPFYLEALKMLQHRVASPATIDAVLRESGRFRMGPFELMDLIGNDVNFAVTKSVFEAFFYEPRFRPSLLQQELVEAGRLGRKTGRGWYEYGENAPPPTPDTEPVVQEKVDGSGVREALAQKGEYGGILFTIPQKRLRPEAVLVDLALDYMTAKRVAVAQGSQCSGEVYSHAVALLQGAGFAVTRIKNVPGMIVYRTIARLADEATHAVNEGVCSEEDLNTAMRKGVNYPLGPLEWPIRSKQ